MKTKELFQKAIRFPKWHRIRSNFVHLDNFGPAELNNINYVLLTNSVFSDLVYKDETWNYIANLDEYRTAMKKGKNLRYPDNKCNYGNKCELCADQSRIHVKTETKNNNWLCFFLNQKVTSSWKLSFTVCIENPFTELQVSFNYVDLGNRYRFMIRDNEEAVFEVVKNGEFFHRLYQKKFSLDYNREYKFEIIRLGKKYLWLIDNNPIWTIKEKKDLFKRDAYDQCLILYNSTDSAAIRCNVKDLNMYRIEGGVIPNLEIFYLLTVSIYQVCATPKMEVV